MSNQDYTKQENVPEAASKTPSAKELAVQAAEETSKTPEPVAIGNEKIAILKHDIYRRGGEGDAPEAIGIGLTIKNVSDTPVGSVLFMAELYDIEGDILDTVEYKTTDLKLSASRALSINYSGPKSDKVKSYCVKVTKAVLTPEPTVAGDERITVLKHNLFSKDNVGGRTGGVRLAIRNVSEVTIASATFETVFYDIEGNVLETVQHKEIEIIPNTSRGVVIRCPVQQFLKLKSYSVRIIRVATADTEKVQIRRNEINTTDTGEEEVRGVVKNISGVKTDAALVATFLDHKGKNIGTRVIILRDIPPNTIRQFHLIFKPIEGDKVKSYYLNIGEVVEEINN